MSDVEQLEVQIRALLEELRRRTSKEIFCLVLQLEELMNLRTALVLEGREGAHTDAPD